jgi:hypothetical protein
MARELCLLHQSRKPRPIDLFGGRSAFKQRAQFVSKGKSARWILDAALRRFARADERCKLHPLAR